MEKYILDRLAIETSTKDENSKKKRNKELHKRTFK